MVERRKRASVTEAVVVRASDSRRENLGILSPETRPFPDDFVAKRQTPEYKESTETEVVRVRKDKDDKRER